MTKLIALLIPAALLLAGCVTEQTSCAPVAAAPTAGGVIGQAEAAPPPQPRERETECQMYAGRTICVSR